MLKPYNQFVKNGMDPDWCWNNFINYRALKQANDIKNQLERILKQQGCSTKSNPPTDPLYYVNIRKCLVSGFFM